MSIFLDLKKACDTVDHNIFLSKLRAYGVIGVSHSWFTSYLTKRKQYCYRNGSSSSKCIIECGIPQGSFSGPLLFILYLNGFENFLEKTTLNINAGDARVNIAASANLNELLADLKIQLDNISNWMRINKLSMNASKNEYMILGHKLQHNRIGNNIPDEIPRITIPRRQSPI